MKTSTILLPLDGSSLSESAIGYAVAMAKAQQARVIVLGVLDFPPADILAGDDTYKNRFTAYVQSVAQRLTGQGIDAVSELRIGRAGEQILDAIQKLQAQLLVMSTHGRSGVSRWWYGSVAGRIAREAPIPTLFIGPHARERAARPDPIKRILAPLDGSPLGEAALETAQELASRFGAELFLVQAVWSGAQNYVWDVPVDTIGQIENELAKAAEEYLARTAARLKASRVKTKVLRSQPADALTDFVAREKIDLVVMASHCRAGVSRTVLGSVADRMVQCGAPVLLVRPNVEQNKHSADAQPVGALERA